MSSGNSPQLKLYFDCGDEDRYGFDEGAVELLRVLEANGFEHEYAIRLGDHGWRFLAQFLEKCFKSIQEISQIRPLDCRANVRKGICV